MYKACGHILPSVGQSVSQSSGGGFEHSVSLPFFVTTNLFVVQEGRQDNQSRPECIMHACMHAPARSASRMTCATPRHAYNIEKNTGNALHGGNSYFK